MWYKEVGEISCDLNKEVQVLWATLFFSGWAIDTQMSLSVSSFINHAHIYIILFSCALKYLVINFKRENNTSWRRFREKYSWQNYESMEISFHEGSIQNYS